MKKKTLLLAGLLLLIGIGYYISLPDYKVYNSMSFSNQDNRETTLHVIAYQFWNTDELMEEIRSEHDRINGTPTKLEIELYRSRWHMRHSEPFKIKIYEKEPQAQPQGSLVS